MKQPQEMAMRFVGKLLGLIICNCLIAHAQAASDIRGTLELVDVPGAATPVEAMLVTLRPLGTPVVPPQATPDPKGVFVLNHVVAGRYALELHVPGRIISFTQGSRELAPADFALSPSEAGAFRIVVSLKSSEVLVEALGMPGNNSKRVVVLAPADALLTLRESCSYNELRGSQTKGSYVPLGTYRVFVVDQESLNDISMYASRFPAFLRDRSAPFAVSPDGATKVTATYVDPETIRQAVREFGPVP